MCNTHPTEQKEREVCKMYSDIIQDILKDFAYGEKQDLSALTDVFFRFHHSALGKGYVSRKYKVYKVEEYHGKFGDGIKIHYPCLYSTRYHIVCYYILRDKYKSYED